MILNYYPIALRAASKVKRILYRKGLLSDDKAGDVDTDSIIELMKATAKQQPEGFAKESIDTYFRRRFSWFVKQQLKKAFNVMNNKKNHNISITRPDGTDRDFHDAKQDWLDGDVLDYTGCPYAEYVQRIFIDKEEVKSVFPTASEQNKWYNKMLPEIKQYLKDLYDLEADE